MDLNTTDIFLLLGAIGVAVAIVLRGRGGG